MALDPQLENPPAEPGTSGSTNQDNNTDVPPAAGEDENMNDAPQSPPLPQRHIAVTPGPRATRLQELYAQRLKKTLGKLGWDNVAGCYPTIAKRSEPVLRQVQGQMVQKLGEKCEKEFENIIVSRQVIPKLNDLETLISDASGRRAEAPTLSDLPTPPHLLPPSTILAAHLNPALTAHQSQLNARLQTTQSQNALLYEEVRQQREEISALLEQLDTVVADVQGANDALRPVIDEIAAETREGLAAVEARRTAAT